MFRWTSLMTTLSLALALWATAPVAGLADEVGIDEHLGETIPLDLEFVDEAGNPVTLRDVVKGPTVLSMVYFSCPGICTPLLNGMVQVFNKTPLEPGEDFRVVTVSFDTRDTPDVAAGKKANYLNQIKRDFPADHWRFLTGTQENIDKLTDAVGFRYKKADQDFIHPATLVVLSPNGKIARYLYGVSYQPFDLKMALTEASEERWGPSIRKVILMCFSYDPEGRQYVANVTRIGGLATLLLAAIFVVVVLLRSRREPTTAEPASQGGHHGQ